MHRIEARRFDIFLRIIMRRSRYCECRTYALHYSAKESIHEKTAANSVGNRICAGMRGCCARTGDCTCGQFGDVWYCEDSRVTCGDSRAVCVVPDREFCRLEPRKARNA